MSPAPAPTGPSAVKRYGPLVGIVVVIAVIAVVVMTTSKGSDTAATSANPTNGSGTSSGKVPITYEEAKKAGTAGSTDWGANCDTATGNVKLPSVYAPPCVPQFTGDNGGATAPGVTGDTITIVYYAASFGGDIMSLLGGKMDTPDQVDQTIAGYQEMFNSLFQTYGRKVEIKRYDAKAGLTDAVGGTADAQAVIERFHPFASINGPILTSSYSDELTRNGVLCFNCGLAVPDTAFQEQAPHMWGQLMSPEQFLQIFSDYVAKRLVGRPAAHAGGELKGQTRKLGVVHFENDPPAFKEVEQSFLKCANQVGWSPAANEAYGFDLGKMPERAATIVAKLRSENITTVVFFGDPLMPIYLTKAATAQGYFPEWVITGTPYTDTSTIARLYDQQQWQHAFGVSQLAARMPREQFDAWQLYEWYFGRTPEAANTNAVVYPAIFQLFQGIHMAGPNLTAESFRDGMFHLPPEGGGPTTVHVSYGEHDYFQKLDTESCQFTGPRTDYLAVDDMSEIWWDATTSGPDEQGNVGVGVYRAANGGKRYLAGQMPAAEPDAFKVEGSIVTLDKPTPEEGRPSYPSPNR